MTIFSNHNAEDYIYKFVKFELDNVENSVDNKS